MKLDISPKEGGRGGGGYDTCSCDNYSAVISDSNWITNFNLGPNTLPNPNPEFDFNLTLNL